MRIPDPIANTTTEAYLAYKAGVLSEGELKPKLYDPYIHLDAWLAYWAGLTTTYPVKNVGKNLFDIAKVNHLALSGTIVEDASYRGYTLKVFPGETYTISRASTSAPNRFRYCFTKVVPAAGGAYYGLQQIDSQIKDTFTVPDEMNYLLVYLSNLNDTITESMGIQIEEGSTATAYEPYTGEPEMLTDEEALIAYLSGVTNTYPEEFRDPADVRVAAYLKYLVSARWGRPEYPVTNEELYLSMMDAPYIPAGEPSSDIEIDDTAEAPFKDVKMYGDTSQTTYTGKNLWPINSSIPTYNCTITPGDNSLAIVATGANSNIYPHFYLEANTQYTFSGEFKITDYVGASSIGVIIQGYNGDAWVVIKDGRSEVSDTNTHTFSVSFSSASYSMVRVGFGTNVWNTSVANTVVLSNPQLEKSATATDYEPYTGGVPAPNPDYPQAVNTVTGRQVVKVEGKNLLDSSSENITQKFNCTTEDVDNGIKVDGTSSGSLHYATLNITGIERLLGQEVTITCNYAGSTLSRVAVYYIKSGGQAWTHINELTNNDGVASKTFTMPDSLGEYIGIGLVLYTGGNESSTYTNLQIEKGSTATAYEPYQSQSYEVNLGKNLFDVQDATGTRGNNTVVASSQTITLNSNTSGTETAFYLNDVSQIGRYLATSASVARDYKITGFGGSYILCITLANIPSGSGPLVWCAFTNKRVLQYNRPDIADSKITKTITLSDDEYIKSVQFYTANANVFSDFTMTVQLEKGSQATSYAAYFEPIELCKIGDYQDYIYENDGKWYVHKATGKYTFTGSETVGKAGDASNNSFYYASTQNVGTFGFSDIDTSNMGTGSASTVVLAVWSDRFLPSGTASIITSDRTGISFNKTNNGIDCRLGFGLSSPVNTAQLLTTWLTNNKPSVYYPLATATDTEITNTALIDQLNALKNGGSYTGTTYIKVSATDPNLPGLLKVEAYKYD